jgi:excisionase family DNA binding protein
MDFHIAKGDKSMLETTQSNELSYKSTRETAKILQVSLGTIQKMVETGELIAWKTRGGHRRILDLSIERQLAKRHELLRHFCSKKYSILGVFSNTEDIESFENNCLTFESKIHCYSFLDISEALMAGVELKPEIIYIDHKLNTIDQYHLLHQFNKNTITRQIPLLIHQDIMQASPEFSQNPAVLSPFTKSKMYGYSNSREVLESIIQKALVEKLL